MAALPEVTPFLNCDNRSIFKNNSSNNENCAKWLWITAVADHIHPASDGGPTEPNNLIAACARCNYGKVDWTLKQLHVQPPEVPIASRYLL